MLKIHVSVLPDSSLFKIMTLGVIDHSLNAIWNMLTNTCTPIIIEICIFSAAIGLIINNKHLLISLLFLERIMLALVILIPLSIIASSSHSIFIRIILLSVGACEASLGLALIVIMSRSYGSDIINSLTSNKC